jgi:hypothetical protein
MKVIAVIEPACADTCLRRSRDRQAADRRPAIIRQILEHLGLSTAAPSFRVPPDPPDGRGADPPREWSYDLLFDLPVHRTQTGDLPVPDPACLPAGRCAHSRGRGTGLSRLIFSFLKTRKIPLAPPLRW